MTSKTGIRADAKHMGGEVLLTVAGAVTSLLAIGIIYIGRTSLGIDLSGFSLWLVIPAGAIATGMLAASGYYFGAVVTGRRPSKQLLVNMVLIGLSTFAAIQYLVYLTFTFEDGTLVSDYVGFWEYYRAAIETQSMSFGYRARVHTASTGPLGGFGYLVEGIQLAGFLFGGVAVWAWLAARPYCASCSRYYKSRALAYTHKDNPGVETYLNGKGISLPGMADRVAAAAGRKPLIGARLKLERCPSCTRQQLAVFAVCENDEIRAGDYDVSQLQTTW